MLTNEQVAAHKAKLEEEKKKLIEEIASKNPHEDFGSDIDGFDEEADEAEEFGNRLAVIEALKTRVNEIDAAINKIAKGEYGICQQCGMQISDSLLAAVPESLLCEHCKTLGKK